MGQKVHPRAYRAQNRRREGVSKRTGRGHNERGIRERSQAVRGTGSKRGYGEGRKGRNGRRTRRVKGRESRGKTVNRRVAKDRGDRYELEGSYYARGEKAPGARPERVMEKAHKRRKAEEAKKGKGKGRGGTKRRRRRGGPGTKRERRRRRSSRRGERVRGKPVVRKRRDRNRRTKTGPRAAEKEAVRETRQKTKWKVHGRTAEGVAGRVARSGRRPVAPRMAEVIRRGLEPTRKHREFRFRRKKVRSWHAKQSSYGRKLPGKPGTYRGRRVEVNGTRDGGLRTRNRAFTVGTVPLGTIDARIDSSRVQAKTTVGTLGVRVRYSYGLAKGPKGRRPRTQRKSRGKREEAGRRTREEDGRRGRETKEEKKKRE
jgi:hypothetical protein